MYWDLATFKSLLLEVSTHEHETSNNMGNFGLFENIWILNFFFLEYSRISLPFNRWFKIHFIIHLQFWQAHVWFEAIKQSGQFSFKKCISALFSNSKTTWTKFYPILTPTLLEYTKLHIWHITYPLSHDPPWTFYFLPTYLLNAPNCKMWQMRVLLAKLFVCQQKKIRFSLFFFCPQSKLGRRTLL